MKKTLIIALSCIAIMFAACKKPVEPTPDDPTPVDYTANYVGDYLGQFVLTISSMNNQDVSNMSFPIDSIRMDIAKGNETNSISATVTIDNESYQTNGIAKPAMAELDNVHLILNKPDFSINCNIKLVALPAEDGKLDIRGDFSGNGTANIMGEEQIFDEISGTVVGNLSKQ